MKLKTSLQQQNDSRSVTHIPENKLDILKDIADHPQAKTRPQISPARVLSEFEIGGPRRVRGCTQ